MYLAYSCGYVHDIMRVYPSMESCVGIKAYNSLTRPISSYNCQCKELTKCTILATSTQVCSQRDSMRNHSARVAHELLSTLYEYRLSAVYLGSSNPYVCAVPPLKREGGLCEMAPEGRHEASPAQAEASHKPSWGFASWSFCLSLWIVCHRCVAWPAVTPSSVLRTSREGSAQSVEPHTLLRGAGCIARSDALVEKHYTRV